MWHLNLSSLDLKSDSTPGSISPGRSSHGPAVELVPLPLDADAAVTGVRCTGSEWEDLPTGDACRCSGPGQPPHGGHKRKISADNYLQIYLKVIRANLTS